MSRETKTMIMLSMDEMQTIARMFDIAVRTQGIQVVKQIAPILEILDEAIQENAKADNNE